MGWVVNATLRPLYPRERDPVSSYLLLTSTVFTLTILHYFHISPFHATCSAHMVALRAHMLIVSRLLPRHIIYFHKLFSDTLFVTITDWVINLYWHIKITTVTRTYGENFVSFLVFIFYFLTSLFLPGSISLSFLLERSKVNLLGLLSLK
jgi:hypothetical protein